MKKYLFTIICIALFFPLKANYILIPMDGTQSNHLKAYGIAFWALKSHQQVNWLLNYKGGSFLFSVIDGAEGRLGTDNVSYQVLSQVEGTALIQQLEEADKETDVIELKRVPRIAVYAPDQKELWDDAVLLALDYAGISYDVVYDKEVLTGQLNAYDWVHLHHEDFTGQHGKLYNSYRNVAWYKQSVAKQEEVAQSLGHNKVSQMKLAVAHKLKSFVKEGGHLFAMCSATDTYDIALAAAGVDICSHVFDGDPVDSLAQQKLDFTKTFAFEDFELTKSPYKYEFSSIDANTGRRIEKHRDVFLLQQYSAKSQPILAMLTQNHETTIKGFMGATTAFRYTSLKAGVEVLAETSAGNEPEARYIYGQYGEGSWAFYGGHDPEDYRHYLGEDPTDLSKTPNSPGYRIIFNNIFFPASGIIDISHSLNVFPNPVKNQLSIRLDTPTDGELSISLLDSRGRKYYQEETQKPEGQWEHTFKVEQLAEGMYFLHIKQGRQRASVKVIKE